MTEFPLDPPQVAEVHKCADGAHPGSRRVLQGGARYQHLPARPPVADEFNLITRSLAPRPASIFAVGAAPALSGQEIAEGSPPEVVPVIELDHGQHGGVYVSGATVTVQLPDPDATRFHQGPEPCFALMHRRLGGFSGGEVADETGEKVVAAGSQMAEGDFDWELPAVLMPPDGFRRAPIQAF